SPARPPPTLPHRSAAAVAAAGSRVDPAAVAAAADPGEHPRRPGAPTPRTEETPSMLIALIVVVVLVVVVGLIAVTALNRLRGQRVSVDEAFAGIDVQLTRRADLIPNLVETVKGYMTHERGTLEAVTQARAAAQSANTVGEKAAADGQMRQALANLFAVAE